MLEMLWTAFLSTQGKALIISCVVLLALAVIPRSSAQERFFALKLLLGLLLLLPLLNWLPDTFRIETQFPRLVSLGDRFVDHSLNSNNIKTAKPSDIFSIWRGIFMVGYLVISSVLLIRLLQGWISTNRRVGSFQHIEDEKLKNILMQTANRLKIDKAVKLVFCPDGCTPYAWNLINSTIVLPREALSWSRSQQQSVISHELIHIKRRDLFICLVTEIVCCLYWINPLAWLVARRLKYELECSCDDYSISTGINAIDYAEHLVLVAKQSAERENNFQRQLMMASSSSLTSRIELLTTSHARRRAMNRNSGFAIVCAFLLVALPVIAAKNGDGGRGKLVYSDDYNQQAAIIDLQDFFNGFERQVPESFSAYTITIFPDQLLISLTQDALLKNAENSQVAAIMRWLESRPEVHDLELISLKVENDVRHLEMKTYISK